MLKENRTHEFSSPIEKWKRKVQELSTSVTVFLWIGFIWFGSLLNPISRIKKKIRVNSRMINVFDIDFKTYPINLDRYKSLTDR